MHTFTDRGGWRHARPENTARRRAYLENSYMPDHAGQFCYSGPMFRYDRPQAGRFRQFHQVGVEVFGANTRPDCEVIAMAMDFYGGLPQNLS